MKPTITNRIPIARLCSIALAATVASMPVARSQPNAQAQQIIPMIEMHGVPLTDAINNLARQTDQNYILDPRLCRPWTERDGKPGREPSLTLRWENLSAEEALGRVLKEHGLAMVANPATSIARIVYTNQATAPVPSGAVGGGTNTIIPLVVMDDVPLVVAIQRLATEAHIRLAPEVVLPVSSGRTGQGASSLSTVSFRWKNVTARQALVALLDNYDMLLVEDSAAASARIVARPQTQGGKAAEGK